MCIAVLKTYELGRTSWEFAVPDLLFYAQVIGQTADLVDLQRILLRSKNKLSSAQQQNMTVRSRCSDGSTLMCIRTVT